MDDAFGAAAWQDIGNAILTGSMLASAAEQSLGGKARQFLELQSELQQRSKTRFNNPDKWVWTRKLLEQASDQRCAELTASYFPEGVPIYDLCCGAGADAVALANRSEVTAVDCSPIAASITRINGYLNEKSLRTCVEDVANIRFDRSVWVHVDPDRRSDGRRTTNADKFSPNWGVLTKSITSTDGGSIKVAPASSHESFFKICLDADGKEIVPSVQFVSWGGSVRQQRWWWNCDAFKPCSITLSVWGSDRKFHHHVFDEVMPNNSPSILSDIAELCDGGCFIGDADGAVRAAKLQSTLASQLGLTLIGSSNGFFFRDEPPSDAQSSLITWFQVDETLPFDRKKLKRFLREREIGVLEIKTRNLDIDIDRLRVELQLRGENSATLLGTKCGSRAVAILARRINRQSRACD
jgi:SAM-dependent methyltransferase